jgi:subtilisin family serine protease
VDTVVNGPHHESYVAFTAAGKRTGHGTAWLWAPEWAMPRPEAWEPVEDPPVVALLDTEVHDHTWLADSQGSRPFLVLASDHDWPHPAPAMPAPPDGGPMPVGKYYGHGTFIAGLVRRRAPGAQVLSVPVMDEAGDVDDRLLAEALDWLSGYQDRHRRRMVVLMAFGRPTKAGGPDLDSGLTDMKDALGRLARPGVEIVASAGNDASERPRYPAAFAADPELSASVVSVGARVSDTERAPFSNFGVWVREWRAGRNIVSLMPLAPGAQREADGEPFEVRHTDLNNYAWWSGTSFAATIYACEQARHLVHHSRPLATPVITS